MVSKLQVKRRYWNDMKQPVRVLLERDLENYFTKRCKELNILSLKLNVRYKRGWPDRIVIRKNGRVIWVELKRPGGKLSALQEQTHHQLRQEHHEVYVIDSKEGIDDVLGTA
jgi:hypothetical protein